MLELIVNQKNNLEEAKKAIGEDQSLLFINEIIDQIKFAHVEEVWNANIQSLFAAVESANQTKHLMVL